MVEVTISQYKEKVDVIIGFEIDGGLICMDFDIGKAPYLVPEGAADDLMESFLKAGYDPEIVRFVRQDD
jgi:hypothetical protein